MGTAVIRKWLILAFLVHTVLFCLPTSAAADKRPPNILFIFTDDQSCLPTIRPAARSLATHPDCQEKLAELREQTVAEFRKKDGGFVDFLPEPKNHPVSPAGEQFP
jgi:hypothetical protein